METVVCLLNSNGDHLMHRRRGQRPVCGGASQSWRKELRNFVAQAVAEDQATLLGKAAMKEPWTQNAGLTKKRSMRFGSSTREWPGVSFVVPLRKKWSATYEGKRCGYGCSVDTCGGSTVDWRTAYALFHCMDRWVAPPKHLWQMPAALQLEAARQFADSECTRDGSGSGDVGEWRNESTRLVLQCCWCETQPFRDQRLARPVSPLTWPPWLGGDIPLLWPIRKASLRVRTCLQGTGICIHAWSATTKQTVWIR